MEGPEFSGRIGLGTNVLGGEYMENWLSPSPDTLCRPLPSKGEVKKMDAFLTWILRLNRSMTARRKTEDDIKKKDRG